MTKLSGRLAAIAGDKEATGITAYVAKKDSNTPLKVVGKGAHKNFEVEIIPLSRSCVVYNMEYVCVGCKRKLRTWDSVIYGTYCKKESFRPFSFPFGVHPLYPLVHPFG